jgi:hypothetical protein
MNKQSSWLYYYNEITQIKDMTYKHIKWNSSSNNNNNNNNKRNATRADTLFACLFVCLFTDLFISHIHSSSFAVSLQPPRTMFYTFLLLFLLVRGCLMHVIQRRFLPPWASQNVRTHWQKFHIFMTWKNPERWASQAKFWGTPGQRCLKYI